MCQTVHEHLAVSSQISLSRRPSWTESSPYINREQEAVVVKVPGIPPAEGADGDGAREASQAREKLPNCHRKCNADP